MIKNDYKRALILLRSNVPGYSGHVRLERRTLMGSMYFTVQSAQEGEKLRAALIGRDKKGYYACGLGDFRSDGRQQSLSASFDPRNICKRELEQYQLIAVLRQDAGGCRIVLFGNLNGYAQIDWEAATQAACSLTEQVEEKAAPIVAEEPAEVLELPLPEIEVEPAPEAARVPEQEIEATPEQAPAGALLNVNMDLPWSAEIEGLRSLFQSMPPVEIAPDGDYIYIAAPMSEESGYDHCVIGLKSENGALTGVSYALPSLYSPDPPAGLEDYRWTGDNNRGWWVRQIPLSQG